ncbi:galactose oxidase-like domain-containing protein [Variovorax sp. PAMC 28711]|uniref:galactose oxidase-like domain-containing protein n=1 Tax=Variovorax sp. PAMC 28711 TaxID=1795631 RepID=UPI0009E7E7F9|nr:galactose oxidase-like domain-containing protein [Variovorax sp. PAMC 28711]
MTSSPSSRLPVLALLPALLLAACGGGGGASGIGFLPGTTGTAGAPAATEPGAPTSPSSPTTTPATPAASAPRAAALVSPAADSKLPGADVRFSWGPTEGDDYALRIESASSTTPLYDGIVTGSETTVKGLPTQGEALTATLTTRKDGVWLAPVVYHFTAAGYTALQSNAAVQPWTDPIPLTLVPAAAANLPDGQLLLWAAGSDDGMGGLNITGRTLTAVFDPQTQTATPRMATETGHNMVCPGISMLADGSFMVTGGWDSGKTTLYDPSLGGWVGASSMNIARGYQSSTTMSDGSVFLVGGSWNGLALGGKYGEVWSASARTWRTLSDVPADMPSAANANDPPLAGPDLGGYFRADNHMWLFGSTDGWVFHAGPSAAMHWIDTRGNGKIVQAGPRGDDAYAMTGGAVMYDVNKILKVAGSPGHDYGIPLKTAYSIDISAGAPKPPTVRKLAPMAYGRTFSNSVVLPNGDVVVIGGMTEHGPTPDDFSVLTPELWNPATETFMPLRPMQVPRNYHSVALLLIDGRVLAGGGGLCGTGCAANHPNAEILTPPYLLTPNGKLAERPAITAAPALTTYGSVIAVKTDRAVSHFALVRMASATHSVNTDQRRIPVSFTGATGDYALTIPTERGVLLPGNYMLFALDAQGVPSVARTINVR